MPPQTSSQQSEIILKVMAAAAFLVFFNGYMIAPLVPALAREFHATEQQIGLVVPAYLIPYGFSTLLYGPLSDRVGRLRVLMILFVISIFTTFSLAFATGPVSLIALRFICGLCAGGIAPVALALIADLFPYHRLGHAMGWMFGAIAGGLSFGSTFGAWLNPFIGWRYEFIALATANAVITVVVYRLRGHFASATLKKTSLAVILSNYFALISKSRGRRTFSYIFLNGVFHSGIFSWLGYYLTQRFALGDVGIGTALIGYGLPGMFLGPLLGKLADRFGRSKIIPAGFLVAALCAFGFIPTQPLWTVMITITILSVGFDMSHPLMAGIVASLDPERRGQAMGLNAFALFTGFGLGAFAFQLLLRSGMNTALTIFALGQLFLAALAFPLFRHEHTAESGQAAALGKPSTAS